VYLYVPVSVFLNVIEHESIGAKIKIYTSFGCLAFDTLLKNSIVRVVWFVDFVHLSLFGN
jgi:hypothetical protein